jgi:hypothetical protein
MKRVSSLQGRRQNCSAASREMPPPNQNRRGKGSEDKEWDEKGIEVIGFLIKVTF